MSTLTAVAPAKPSVVAPASHAGELAEELERQGIVRLPALVDSQTLGSMQDAFSARLQRMRWNDFDGYERTERYRFMVQDLLTLAPGYMKVALHPLVKGVLNRYLGDTYEMVEAKGWKSLPTKRDFHGWHGDCWYDQAKISDRIPREIKLGFYLTDVKSGAFQFLRGTHGKQRPRQIKKNEVPDLPMERMVEMAGPAGSAFLFDTSGIHRQAIPILEPRDAFFFTYHDARVPLQTEDVTYYRYHPLNLNASFLGGLTTEDARILGFGNLDNYMPAFQRQVKHCTFQTLMRCCYGAKLLAGEFTQRVTGKLKRVFKRGA